MPRVKRSLRGSKIRARLKNLTSEVPESAVDMDGVPVCPEHHTVMKFSTETFVWECSKCKYTVMPRSDISYGTPVVGEGVVALQVVSTPERTGQEFYLRALDNNVMINITPYIRSASTYSAGTITGAAIDVELALPKAIVMEL